MKNGEDSSLIFFHQQNKSASEIIHSCFFSAHLVERFPGKELSYHHGPDALSGPCLGLAVLPLFSFAGSLYSEVRPAGIGLAGELCLLRVTPSGTTFAWPGLGLTRGQGGAGHSRSA